ncbi:MAG: MAE_28990/MAE_18760 family HEPN-like nuclease [Hydrogenophaga sp.]|nr:MAE_28990/MAE_18760 family HEPN-like nuclease [Hydrogenophaga sp.]
MTQSSQRKEPPQNPGRFMSACVTRLYAIYEDFVETLVSDYLDVVPDLCAFEDLTDTMRAEYRVGISHLLNRLESPRYRHLNHGDLIRWYHEALTAHSPYRFVPEALTRHDENLRLAVLDGMLKRVQLADLQGWLSHHEAIAALFDEPVALWGQVEAELKNFIQLRNDAAHGSLSSLAGPETLLRHCDLSSALVQALSAYLYRDVVLWRKKVNKVRRIGRVSEVFEKAGAFIVPLSPGMFVSMHERVHLVGRWSCVEATIESLKLEEHSIDGVGASSGDLEVGVVASALPKRQMEIYADI